MIDKVLLLTNLRSDLTIYWVSFVVLVSLILVAYVKQHNDAVFISFKSFFNFRFFRQSLREETNSSKLYARILLFNSFVVMAIVLNYFIGNVFEAKYGLNSFLAYLLFLFIVLIWYGLNFSVKKIIAKVSGVKVVEVEGERYNQFFFQVLGMVLLPGVLGLYFFPLEILGLYFKEWVEFYIQIMVIVLLLNKLIQSIFQSFEIKISWFYIFLYICTLEILPLCVGFQLLVQ